MITGCILTLTSGLILRIHGPRMVRACHLVPRPRRLPRRARREREALDFTTCGTCASPGDLIVCWGHCRFHNNLFSPGFRLYDVSFSRWSQVKTFQKSHEVWLIHILVFSWRIFPYSFLGLLLSIVSRYVLRLIVQFVHVGKPRSQCNVLERRVLSPPRLFHRGQLRSRVVTSVACWLRCYLPSGPLGRSWSSYSRST